MKRISLWSLALFSAVAISCEKDDENQNPDPTPLPETYDFENVSYSGQTQRLDMLSEVVAYMKTANDGQPIDAAQLQNMFSNENYTWQQADLNSSTKELTDKIADGEGPFFGEAFSALEAASQSTQTGGNGTAGLVSSNDGAKTYLFDENGIEPLQIIEKGAMGAVFFYQATAVYFGDGKMEVDNETVEDGQGTEMQHHWDEAFGYWGVPQNFGSEEFTYEKGADYDRFWAKYTNGRDELLNCNEALMNAFIKGRDAINRKDYPTRDEAIEEAREIWGQVVAATAIHYLNGAKADFADDALRNHQLSEFLAFTYSLQFSPSQKLTDAEVEDVMDNFENLYEITLADINATSDKIAAAYDLEDVKDQL